MKFGQRLSFPGGEELHATVNRLHDIKHAFDSRKLDIEDYHGGEGNDFPRRAVDSFAVCVAPAETERDRT